MSPARAVDLHRGAGQTRFLTHHEGSPMEQDEQQTAEGPQRDERNEVEDLDVAQEEAEDVKGGTYATGRVEPRFPKDG